MKDGVVGTAAVTAEAAQASVGVNSYGTNVDGAIDADSTAKLVG
eukprot:CAMPEP_0194059264 /NCGR_PEP_ID=MMETSP0009_2-20130614/68512_1 /TAXON_ID=210454 /ORGANISM="Grammatophora oceanica, Strain CCMP 410" /LENGTH=43 /DNA_ID= /DNA_START= /DNA_END= /DNA_ORIENTATION=